MLAVEAMYVVVTGQVIKCYSHCWSALNLSPGNAPSALWSSCPPELLWSSRHCDWGVLVTKEKVTLFCMNSSFLCIVCTKHMKWTHYAKVIFAHLSVSSLIMMRSLWNHQLVTHALDNQFLFWRRKRGFWDHHDVYVSFHFKFWIILSNFMTFGKTLCVRWALQNPVS